MKNMNFLVAYSDVVTYDASARNCFAFRRGQDVREGLLAKGMKKAAIKREQDRMRLGEWSRVGVFVGMNIMGKILMECREALVSGGEPTIDYALLRSKHINLLGKELTFQQQLMAA